LEVDRLIETAPWASNAIELRIPEGIESAQTPGITARCIAAKVQKAKLHNKLVWGTGRIGTRLGPRARANALFFKGEINMADSRYGDERYDRYRQDENHNGDFARDLGRSAGRYGDEGSGNRSYDTGSGADRNRYGGGQEDRSFYAGGRPSSQGEDGYRGRAYGSNDRQNETPWYGRSADDRTSSGRNGPGSYGRQYFDDRYSDRQAAGAMLHQGYRAPFGERSDFDRNAFRPYDGEGQRYQYNNYQPTHDPSGRFAHGGAEYGAGQDRGLWDQTRDEVSSWFGDDAAKQRRKLDGARAEHHGGKGPKGYTRSDDRIREDLSDRLTDDYSLDASDIDVKVEKGEVTLSGHVASRADKRRAEDLADSIGGVQHVQNNLRLKEQAGSGGSAYASSSGSAQSTGASVGSTGSASGASSTRSN